MSKKEGKKCPDCNGTGKTRRGTDGYAGSYCDCPRCKGTGKIGGSRRIGQGGRFGDTDYG